METLYKKAILFIPNTEENIDLCELDNQLSLINPEGIEVDVEMLPDEEGFIDGELYDIVLNDKEFTNIDGEWLTLKLNQ